MTAPAAPLELRPTPLELLRSGGTLRRRLALLGPAFIAAVAYVDPGNFATNSTAGASTGFLLVWVVVASNLLAVLVQNLTAKLGIATGRSLPELCRQEYSRPVVRLMWAQAELVAMATDVAEVLGGAVALYLLFGLPLLPAGVVVGLAGFALLGLRSRGYRGFEVAITLLLGVVLAAFAINLFRVGVPVAGLVAGMVPRLDGPDSLLLATGILGATVMPHVVYVHSALSRDRAIGARPRERRSLLRASRVDIGLALGAAGLVNLAMLLLAAVLFRKQPIGSVDGLQGVTDGLGRLVGPAAAVVFALALLASGLSSTSVGTYAGEVIMDGFLRRRISSSARRAITLAPALLVLASGVGATQALVLSQVVLSFGIPFALIPLVRLTRRSDLMGEFVNRRSTTVTASGVAALICGLNAFLVLQL